MQLLVATRNRHKLQEIRDLFRIDGLELLGASDIDGLPEVEEDGLTFYANAIKKAEVLCRASGLWTLADDSGLEVDALDGRPGVHSARYAGEDATDADNNHKLLRALRDNPNRKASFRCVIALAAPDRETMAVEGSCAGRILEEARGEQGFGYDPLFVPDGYDGSFGELGMAVKTEVSHRARALAEARRRWAGLLKQPA